MINAMVCFKWMVSSLLAVGLALPVLAQERSIVLASTSTTDKSGLLTHVLPAFKQASGIDVKVLTTATTTAQALEAARRGEADVVLVHDPVDEARFLADGFSLKRQEVMRNDFVLIGPAGDPAGARGGDIVAALGKLAAAKARFVSRADQSGTHAAELRYWKAAGQDPAGVQYKACNCGMSQALGLAATDHAYVLADRGAWALFKDRADLAVLVEGDSRLANPFAVMVVNPAKNPKVKLEAAQAFADWLASSAGQAAISAYRVQGEALFVASVAK